MRGLLGYWSCSLFISAAVIICDHSAVCLWTVCFSVKFNFLTFLVWRPEKCHHWVLMKRTLPLTTDEVQLSLFLTVSLMWAEGGVPEGAGVNALHEDYLVVSRTLLSADTAQSEGKQCREKWMGCVSRRQSWKHNISQLSIDWGEMGIIDSDRNLEYRYTLLPSKARPKGFNP